LAKSDPDQMTALAWDQLKQIQDTGQLTLPNGKALQFDPDSVLRVLQWLATQKARKPRVLDSPDDLAIPTTRGSRA